jgi:hypothetical protein
MSGAKQTGGGPVNDTYAIYDPATGLGPPQPAPFLFETPPFDTYPFVYVLPDGRLVVHTGDKACLLDLATGTFGAERFKTIRAEARTYPLEGTAVLLPLLPDSTPPYRARVMLIGGGGLPPGTHTPATETCEILDMSNPQPAWKSAPSMFAPRVMPDAVLLPDATVLVMNGSAAGKADDAIAPVFQTDLYDPEGNQWSAMAKRRIPRLYHATALLLPDATVMTAGTDEAFNPEPFHYPEYRLEIFRPPYLFRGPRPEIVSAPATIPYGGSFQVGTTNPASIASAALLRNGAVTHSNNMDQRYVGLRITGRSATGLTIEGPPNAKIAPPGQYLLFILDGSKVPSKAKFVRVG